MFYTGDQGIMTLDPTIHAKAILEGIMSETDSKVIPFLCKIRLQHMEQSKNERTQRLGNALNIEDESRAKTLFQKWYNDKWDRVYKKEFFSSGSKEQKESIDWEYEHWLLKKVGISIGSIVEL
jgi:hypothetical protein